MKYLATIHEAAEQLRQNAEKEFVVLLQHGTMKVEYYAPQVTDKQIPHRQDELYVITSGSGTFFRNGERTPFKTGDVIFVPAGMEHRFENFSTDFAAWVIFYGKVGGEVLVSD